MAELPLGPLASQLLAFLRASSAQNEAYQRFDEAIEWADLAARLIRWKWLLIAPAHGPEERAVAEAELRQEIDERFRALERAHIGCLREWLAHRWLAAGGALEATGQAEDGVAQGAGESASSLPCGRCGKNFRRWAAAHAKAGTRGVWLIAGWPPRLYPSPIP